jgi:hypothetical protein
MMNYVTLPNYKQIYISLMYAINSEKKSVLPSLDIIS